MIPDSIPPNQAPGGIVCIAFDFYGRELTRSHVTQWNSVEWQASDAGELVASTGGGSISAYDGDTGELMFKGPNRLVDEPYMHDVGDLADLAHDRHPLMWP